MWKATSSPFTSIPLLLLLFAGSGSQQKISPSLASNPPVSTEQGTQICYDFNGFEYPNNIQCPGSFACCASANLCTGDRLCKSSTDQLVRATCALPSWNSRCANICLYSNDDGFLPRVNVCKDGSYCCDNDPACCSEGRGIVMNGSGDIVSTKTGTGRTASSSSFSSSSSSTASSSPTTPSILPSSSSSVSGVQAPDSAALSPSQDSAGGLSAGAKAGIAVGAVIGVLIAAILGFMLMRNQKRIQKLQAALEFNQRDQHHTHYSEATIVAADSRHGSKYKYELPQPPIEMSADRSPRLSVGARNLVRPWMGR